MGAAIRYCSSSMTRLLSGKTTQLNSKKLASRTIDFASSSSTGNAAALSSSTGGNWRWSPTSSQRGASRRGGRVSVKRTLFASSRMSQSNISASLQASAMRFTVPKTTWALRTRGSSASTMLARNFGSTFSGSAIRTMRSESSPCRRSCALSTAVFAWDVIRIRTLGSRATSWRTVSTIEVAFPVPARAELAFLTQLDQPATAAPLAPQQGAFAVGAVSGANDNAVALLEPTSTAEDEHRAGAAVAVGGAADGALRARRLQALALTADD